MSNESSTSFPFASLAVVALFLSTAFLAQDGFDQLRQAEPDASKRKALLPASIDARLWEDPLAALQRHRERLRERCGPSAADATSPAQAGQAGVSAAAVADPRCAQPEALASLDLGIDDSAGSTGGGLRDTDTVIAVLLPGAPFVGAEEARRRMRYAVLSGLTAEGYVPDDSERIGLLRLPVCASLLEQDCARPERPIPVEARAEGAAPAKPGAVRWLDVPYETLSLESFGRTGATDLARAPAPAGNRVIVLWVDDSALGPRWLTALAGMFHALSDRASATTPRLRIVGPTHSGAIVHALDDLDRIRLEVSRSSPAAARWQLLARARLISPAATATDTDLLEAAGLGAHRTLERAFAARILALKCAVPAPTLPPECAPSSRASPVDATEPRAALANASPPRDSPAPFLVRTIGTDERLVALLATELKARGLCRRDGSPAGKVALLAEWDSNYARSFANTLERELRCEGSSPIVLTYPYFRGLDGFTVEGAPPGQVRTGGSRGASESTVPIEWPEGRDQRDYLRRLVAQRLGRDPRGGDALDTGPAHLVAIGIIGSDVHDKLLLAQAVRDAFDDRVLFTTDLDARLLHPNVTAYTRNLIVATSLPLLLPPDLQKGTSPFRDVYQTALFLAARHATLAETGRETTCPERAATSTPDLACEIRAQLDSPRLYEVGRRGMTLLGLPDPAPRPTGPAFAATTGDERSSVDPRELVARRLTAFICALLLLALGSLMVVGYPGPAMQAARQHWRSQRVEADRAAQAPVLHDQLSTPHPRVLAVIAGLQASGLAFAAGVLLELAAPGQVGLSGCALLALSAFVLFWLFVFPGPANLFNRPLGRTRQRLRVAAWIASATLALAWVGWLLPAPAPGIPVHEPFALLEGVSAWPSQLLRTFVLVLFVWFVDFAWSRTATAADAVAQTFFPPVADRQAAALARPTLGSRLRDLSVWLWQPRTPIPAHDGAIDGAALWDEYRWRLRDGPRLLRLAIWLVALIGVLVSVSLLVEGVRPAIPARGEGDRLLFAGTMAASALALAVLLTLVADSTVITWRMHELMRKGRTVYPPATVARYASELGDDVAARACVRLAASPAPARFRGARFRNTLLDDWIDLKLIADHSTRVGPLVLLPFVLLALLLVARSRLFDNWHLGDIVVIVVASLITLAIVNAALLKHGAERSRALAIERMQADLEWLKGAGPRWSGLVERYPTLIGQARTLRTGAFAPLFEQPVVRAVLVPLGGAGGVQLLDLLLFAR